MKTKKKFLLITSLVLSISSACLAAGNTHGGGSDGGGNSYRGKPLESYAKNPLDLSAFKNNIAPLIKDIESKYSPGNNLNVLSNLMASVFTQKIWYFVPGPLEQVPPDLLNSAVRTDQAALQGFDRVWIDENIWNTMTSADQARLLLHESFMGLKILKFAATSRLCIAANPNNKTCDENEDIDRQIVLKSSDYVEVQKMTIQTSNHYQQMGNAEWVRMLNDNHIKFAYDWFDEVTTITPKAFGDLLKKSNISGFLPQFGYNLRSFDTGAHRFTNQQEMYEYLQSTKEACNVSASVTGHQMLHLKLNAASDIFEADIPLPTSINTRKGSVMSDSDNLTSIGIFYPSQQLRPHGGYTSYNIWFEFDSYQLSSVFIQEMVCENPDCQQGFQIDVKGGMTYICSENPELYKPK